VIRLQAAEGDGPYSQLFSYLSVRNRCGVVSSWGSQIKDLYIIPLSSRNAVAPALLPFSGPGVLNSDVFCFLQSVNHVRICDEARIKSVITKSTKAKSICG